MERIVVMDDFLADPQSYREEALKLLFRSYDFEHCVFHGIAVGDASKEAVRKLSVMRPDLTPTLSFFRKSPEWQVEPHFIHTDIDMGDWSAILYLNPESPAEDGTAFWTHKATNAIESPIPHERSIEGLDSGNWDRRTVVESKFNRLLMFPSSYFHSRNIHANWGYGDEARLTQVTFGRGTL